MSDHDWRQTPTLDEFNAMYDEDDNIWWRIACGHERWDQQWKRSSE